LLEANFQKLVWLIILLNKSHYERLMFKSFFSQTHLNQYGQIG